MDFEFSNKEICQVFSNRKVPLNLSFRYVTGAWIMVHFQRFGCFECFFFPVVESAHPKPYLGGSFTDKRAIHGRGVSGNQAVNFCFQQSHREKKYTLAWQNISLCLLKSSKKICVKQAFKWEGCRCFQSSCSLRAGLGQTRVRIM